MNGHRVAVGKGEGGDCGAAIIAERFGDGRCPRPCSGRLGLEPQSFWEQVVPLAVEASAGRSLWTFFLLFFFFGLGRMPSYTREYGSFWLCGVINGAEAELPH